LPDVVGLLGAISTERCPAGVTTAGGEPNSAGACIVALGYRSPCSLSIGMAITTPWALREGRRGLPNRISVAVRGIFFLAAAQSAPLRHPASRVFDIRHRPRACAAASARVLLSVVQSPGWSWPDV
jgi:hypothetical protein